jgi:hypothetical protein
MPDPARSSAGLLTAVVFAMLAIATAPSGAAACPVGVLQAGPLVVTHLRMLHDRSGAVHPDARKAILATMRSREAGRPAALLPLYASFGALQALDGRSTMNAMDRGYREMNPLMGPATGSRGAMIATKLATTAATIAGAELLWRRNRVAAVLTMIGINGAYAAIVAHNYRQLSSAP